MVYVDSSRCAGCGLCATACPVGAIRLVDGKAEINQEQCQGCEACMEACPRGAIISVSEDTLPVPAPSRQVSVRTAPQPPPTTVPRTAWVNALINALEVAPRVLTSLLDIWERIPRHATPTTTSNAPRREPAVTVTPPPSTVYGGGRRRRMRRRGRW